MDNSNINEDEKFNVQNTINKFGGNMKQLTKRTSFKIETNQINVKKDENQELKRDNSNKEINQQQIIRDNSNKEINLIKKISSNSINENIIKDNNQQLDNSNKNINIVKKTSNNSLRTSNSITIINEQQNKEIIIDNTNKDLTIVKKTSNNTLRSSNSINNINNEPTFEDIEKQKIKLFLKNNSFIFTPLNSDKIDYLFKIMILGDSNMGKTTFLNTFLNGYPKSNNRYVATIGIDFLYKILTYKNKNIKLYIWDTSGQDHYGSLIAGYFRDISGIIYIYDITDPRSRESINKWMENAQKNIDNYTDNFQLKIPFIIIANKLDLIRNFDQERKSKILQASKSFSDQHKTDFIACSSTSELDADAFPIYYPILLLLNKILNNDFLEKRGNILTEKISKNNNNIIVLGQNQKQKQEINYCNC